MLRLKLVKEIDLIGKDGNIHDDEPNESSLLHGIPGLKRVVSPLFGSNQIYAQTFAVRRSVLRKSISGTAFVSLALSRQPRKVFPKRTLQVLNPINVGISSPSLRILLLWLRLCGCWIGNAGTSLRQQGLSRRVHHIFAAASGKGAKILTHLQRRPR
jgi:hypothetical protein